MQIPYGYQESEAKEFGRYETLEPGAYICKILKATEEKAKKSNAQMLVLRLDIAEGEKMGFYRNQFDKDTRLDKKWPCLYRQLVEGNSTPYFKGMIENHIEKSNPGYKFNFDENTLAGKLIGVIFGREEYRKEDGTTAFSVKPIRTCSVDEVKAGIERPKDKLLNLIDQAQIKSTNYASIGEEIDDMDLPF